MARNFRSSRFRGTRNIGEDVNPSAYIVNLADCMLVLACGFLVAMISFWQIDLSPNMTKLEGEQLEQIDPEVLPQDITQEGSYYIEAGTAYRDPNTGLVHILAPQDDAGNTAFDTPTTDGVASGTTSGGSGTGAANGAMSDDDIRAARAMGGD